MESVQERSTVKGQSQTERLEVERFCVLTGRVTAKGYWAIGDDVLIDAYQLAKMFNLGASLTASNDDDELSERNKSAEV